MKKVNFKLFSLFMGLCLITLAGCAYEPKLADIRKAANGYYASEDFEDIGRIASDFVVYNGVRYQILDEEREDGTMTETGHNQWTTTNSTLMLICENNLVVSTSMDYDGRGGIKSANFQFSDAGNYNYLNRVGSSEKDLTNKKKAYRNNLIKSIKNKNWISFYFYSYHEKLTDSFDSIKFTDNKVIIDGVSYDIDYERDFLTKADCVAAGLTSYYNKNESKYGWALKCGDRIIGFKDYNLVYEDTVVPYGSSKSETRTICEMNGRYYVAADASYSIEAEEKKDNEPTEDPNPSTDLSSYNGTYSFSTAVRPAMNGSITLNNGNWSYEGEKTAVAAKSGTYTLSGSTFTFKWTANGYEISEEFEITNNGSSSTWKSKASGTSTLFSMLFGVVSTEMTFEL